MYCPEQPRPTWKLLRGCGDDVVSRTPGSRSTSTKSRHTGCIWFRLQSEHGASGPEASPARGTAARQQGTGLFGGLFHRLVATSPVSPQSLSASLHPRFSPESIGSIAGRRLGHDAYPVGVVKESRVGSTSLPEHRSCQPLRLCPRPQQHGLATQYL